MAKPLNDNLHIEAGKPIDDRYLDGILPYANTAAVIAKIPVPLRYPGLVVLVGAGPFVEYWFKDGITNGDLVLKSTGLGYTAEDVANKASDFSTLDNTLYPSTLATNNRIVELAWNLAGTSALLGDNSIDGQSTFNVEFLNVPLVSMFLTDLQVDSGAATRIFNFGANAFGVGTGGLNVLVDFTEGLSISNNAAGFSVSGQSIQLFNSISAGITYDGNALIVDCQDVSPYYSFLLGGVEAWHMDVDALLQLMPLSIETSTTDVLKTSLTLRHSYSAGNPTNGFGVAVDFEKEIPSGGGTALFGRIAVAQIGSGLGANQFMDFYLDGLGGGSAVKKLQIGATQTQIYPLEAEPVIILDDSLLRAQAYAFYATATPPSFLGVATVPLIYYDTVLDDFVINDDAGNKVTVSRPEVKTVSSGTYNFLETDRNKFIRFTNAGGCTATIPTGLTLGWTVAVYRANGAGVVTLASSGTLESVGTQLNTVKTGASIIHIGSNVHVAQGVLS